jgi:hypothetical protein
MAERYEWKKLSHDAPTVSYEEKSKQKEESCSRCEHFVEGDPPRCEIVVSPIEPAGTCKRFEPAQDADEYKKDREENRGKDVDMESRDFQAYRKSREESPDNYLRRI